MTKLYRHYKNKPYRYIGTARHSETLEEMVVYETRYANDLGKTWVRPKALFQSTVQLKGEVIPRFRPIPVEIREPGELNDLEIKTLLPLIERVFGRWNPQVRSRIENHTKPLLLTAYIENEAVGFKLGYELDSRIFYSWIGGVVPEFRGLGVASRLMERQHDWCRAQGYAKVQTKSQNRFRDMFVLNLRRGFNVVGTEQSDGAELKIVLEKTVT